MIIQNGKRIYEGNELPCAPRGERVLVKPDPVREKTEAGLYIPQVAKERCSTGVLLAAGLAAMDQLHDQGDRIGDRMWWGALAGIKQEWDHITEPGKKKCAHPDWDHAPCDLEDTLAYVCRECGAKRMKERILLMSADDLQGNEDLAERIRQGECSQTFDTTSSGRTQYRLKSEKEAGN